MFFTSLSLVVHLQPGSRLLVASFLTSSLPIRFPSHYWEKWIAAAKAAAAIFRYRRELVLFVNGKEQKFLLAR